MKKSFLLLCCVLALPVVAQAGMTVDVNAPGMTIHIGDQDHRGYYWDGYDWRAPQWWHAHQGHHMGERNSRGMYWRGDHWQPSPPPRPAPRPAHYEHGNPHQQERPHGNNGHGDNNPPYPQQDQHR